MLVHLYCLRHIAGGLEGGLGVVKQTVGGLVLTPAPAPQPCSCSSALSLTSHHVLLKPFLHHRRSTPAPPLPDTPIPPPKRSKHTLVNRGCVPPPDSLGSLGTGKALVLHLRAQTSLSLFFFGGGGANRRIFSRADGPQMWLRRNPAIIHDHQSSH